MNPPIFVIFIIARHLPAKDRIQLNSMQCRPILLLSCGNRVRFDFVYITLGWFPAAEDLRYVTVFSFNTTRVQEKRFRRRASKRNTAQ